MRVRRIILSSVAYPAVRHLATFFQRLHDFRNKKVTEHKMRVLIFYKILSETLLITRRIQLDIIIKLAFSTQVRGFKPGRSRRIFKGEKILITPSFGGKVKPSVSCRRFAACKRSLNGVEVVISANLPDNILAHSSAFPR